MQSFFFYVWSVTFLSFFAFWLWKKDSRRAEGKRSDEMKKTRDAELQLKSEQRKSRSCVVFMKKTTIKKKHAKQNGMCGRKMELNQKKRKLWNKGNTVRAEGTDLFLLVSRSVEHNKHINVRHKFQANTTKYVMSMFVWYHNNFIFEYSFCQDWAISSTNKKLWWFNISRKVPATFLIYCEQHRHIWEENKCVFSMKMINICKN